jgi:hypothetical protein
LRRTPAVSIAILTVLHRSRHRCRDRFEGAHQARSIQAH